MGPPGDLVRPSSSSIATAVATCVRCGLAHRPFAAAASLLTLGLFLYNLAPFDFVTTTDALHASFGRARLGLMSPYASTVGTPPFAAIAYQLTGAGWFAVLGYLLALAGRERGDPSAMSLGLALKDGLVLVVLIEFMQLFTYSHTFDAASVLNRSAGVVFGTWSAVFLIDSVSWSDWRCRSGLALPTGLLAILTVFQVGLLIAPCVDFHGRQLSTERGMAVQWLPSEILWRQSHKALAGIPSSLLTFGTLALTLRVFFRRLRVVHPRWWVFAALTLVATACEYLRLATLDVPMDMTTLMSAWVSIVLVWSLPTSDGHSAAIRGVPGPGQGQDSEFR